MIGRPCVEPTDFTGLAIDGQLAFELIDLIERCLGAVVSRWRIERQDHFKRGGHRAAREAQHYGIARRWRRRWPFIGNTEHRPGNVRDAAWMQEFAAVHGGSQPALAKG